jgi:hypothetical protein
MYRAHFGYYNEVPNFLETKILPHARKISAGQPERTWKMLSNETCATFYLEEFADTVDYTTLDLEGSRPALGVTFTRRGEKNYILTAYWNQTPRQAKLRMLQAYAKAAQASCGAEKPRVLIG